WTNCSAEGNGPICLPNASCGCITDSQCGGENSGRICLSGKCQPGCRLPSVQGNRCPPGNTCDAVVDCKGCNPGIGKCVPIPPPDAGVDAGRDLIVDMPSDVPADRPAPVDQMRDVRADRPARDAQEQLFLQGGGFGCAFGTRDMTPAWLGALVLLGL